MYKIHFCWRLLSERLVQPHLSYNLTNYTDLVIPVTIRTASFCIVCRVLESCCVLFFLVPQNVGFVVKV